MAVRWSTKTWGFEWVEVNQIKNSSKEGIFVLSQITNIYTNNS